MYLCAHGINVDARPFASYRVIFLPRMTSPLLASFFAHFLSGHSSFPYFHYLENVLISYTQYRREPYLIEISLVPYPVDRLRDGCKKQLMFLPRLRTVSGNAYVKCGL
jgi:hypothetical protein